MGVIGRLTRNALLRPSHTGPGIVRGDVASYATLQRGASSHSRSGMTNDHLIDPPGPSPHLRPSFQLCQCASTCVFSTYSGYQRWLVKVGFGLLLLAVFGAQLVCTRICLSCSCCESSTFSPLVALSLSRTPSTTTSRWRTSEQSNHELWADLQFVRGNLPDRLV